VNFRFDFQTAIASGMGLETVIAGSEATKQSIITIALAVDCFASLAMTVSVAFAPRNDVKCKI
jgi:hypothetical protein